MEENFFLEYINREEIIEKNTQPHLTLMSFNEYDIYQSLVNDKENQKIKKIKKAPKSEDKFFVVPFEWFVSSIYGNLIHTVEKITYQLENLLDYFINLEIMFHNIPSAFGKDKQSLGKILDYVNPKNNPTESFEFFSVFEMKNNKDQLKNHFSKLLNLASMPDNLSLSFFSNVLAWKIATLDETSEEYQQALADKKEFDKKKGKEQWGKWKTDRHKEKELNDKLKAELVDKIVDLLEQKFK